MDLSRLSRPDPAGGHGSVAAIGQRSIEHMQPPYPGGLKASCGGGGKRRCQGLDGLLHARAGKPPALSFERTRRQLQKIRRRLALARFDRTLYRFEKQVGHRAQLLGPGARCTPGIERGVAFANPARLT
jgi:hypothetical protein